MPSIELHLFTNSTVKAPNQLIAIINRTYSSFNKVFDKELNVSVWCDPSPNIDASQDYINQLKKIFPTVTVTNSLIDGYLKAVRSSACDYLFMLEHDWHMLPTITTPLDDIIECMEENDLWYLIFHKFNNFDTFPANKQLYERHGSKMSFCLTNRISNNPHIICRQKYLDRAPKYINLSARGSLGLEYELTRSPLMAAFYGPLSQKATIKHLDGR